jgi:hypothetical protein
MKAGRVIPIQPDALRSLDYADGQRAGAAVFLATERNSGCSRWFRKPPGSKAVAWTHPSCPSFFHEPTRVREARKRAAFDPARRFLGRSPNVRPRLAKRSGPIVRPNDEVSPNMPEERLLQGKGAA